MADRRGPGRPRKWTDNAERMRAYRAAERDRREVLGRVDHIDELAEQIVQLGAERDRLKAQIVGLQQRIAQLENTLARHAAADTRVGTPSVAAGAPSGLSRAERRRLDRARQRGEQRG